MRRINYSGASLEFNYHRLTQTLLRTWVIAGASVFLLARKTIKLRVQSNILQQRKLGQDVLSKNNRQFRSYSLQVYGKGKGTWREEIIV